MILDAVMSLSSYISSFIPSETNLLNKIEIAINSKNSVELKNLLKNPKITNIDKVCGSPIYDRTILMLACNKSSSIECVQVVLLDYNADINIRSYFGRTAWTEVCGSGNIEIFRYLIEIRGNNINDSVIYGCFMKAFSHDCLKSKDSAIKIEMAKTLATYIQDVNYTEGTISLLDLVCKVGFIDVIMVLLERGVDWNRALYYAAKYDKIDIIKVLFEWNKDLTISVTSINAALCVACAELDRYQSYHTRSTSANLEVVRIMIDFGGDVSAIDERGNSPLMYAVDCSSEKSEVVELLIKSGANVNARNRHGNSVLHIVCSHNRSATVKLLLKHGADPTAIDRYGRVPTSNFPNVLDVLHSHNSNTLTTATGENILYTAYKKFDIKSSELYSKYSEQSEYQRQEMHYDANYVKAYNDGMVALFESCSHEMTLRINKGADINLPLTDGTIILIWAVQQWCNVKDSNITFIKFLLDQGADINQKSNKYRTGNTALMIAIQHYRLDFIQLLLEYGADVTLLNNVGKGAMDMIGWGWSSYKITKLFKQYIDINKYKPHEQMEMRLK